MVNYFETVFIIMYDKLNITKYSKLNNILVNGIVKCGKITICLPWNLDCFVYWKRNKKSYQSINLFSWFFKIHGMFRCVLLVQFREFRENYNFHETRKLWKCALAKLVKFAKVSRNTWAFSQVSCFAKILKSVLSKTLTALQIFLSDL